MKRSDMGPDVDPHSPFGICSACRKVTGERPQTIVSCIVPAVADEPEVDERRSLATFFVLEEDEEPHPAIVYPMPEEELAHPANIHLNNSTTAGFISHPYDVVIFEASMKSPRGHNVISRRYSWGGITEMPAPPEVKSTIEVEQSPTSLRIGGDQEYDDDPVIGWNFRYKLDIKTDTGVQFTRLQTENPDTGEPDIGFSVDMVTGPVDGEESSDCDCALVAAHPGGEDGIREDLAFCMGKPVSHSTRCERVNFSGGDTITSADTRCFGICGWTLKEGEFPIQENIRFRFVKSGEPLPLHEDLNLVSFRSMVATGNGLAAFGLVGDGGTDVLYIYNNGELLSVMRRGDDFGDGEIGGVAGTGSLSNFNRHGQVAVRLHAPPGSTGNWVYLLSDAVSPVPDPSGYSDMWIITSD
ncbi:MAG: hypothetical protein JJU11_04385 [Candidatus Sumerlaeia bacterium]|nr:hypothetical protein [Candidatus Sumerlaeia bacterium]